MMKKLLVGSLFKDDSPEQEQWLDLQLGFFYRTTEDFHHVVRLTEPSERFSKKTNVLVSPFNDHFSGLRFLTDIFRKNKDQYEYFLFIDNDAFPVKKGWLEILLKQMEHREIAALVRCENLETRLHASVLFAKREALNHLEYPLLKPPVPDLLGRDDTDVIIQPYENQRRNLAFPLLRSNKVELHPLLCGVYYDLFYHHGCGSRSFIMRSQNYWSHTSLDSDVKKYHDKLMENPIDFIGNLMWSDI